MHLSEEQLVAYIDQELSASENARLQEHLKGCAECGEQLRVVQERVVANRKRMDVLTPIEEPDGSALLNQLQMREGEGFERRSKWKPAWAAGFVLAALLAGFSFKPVRVWATEFLSLFRVQQIAVIQIDPANLQRLETGLFGTESEKRIEQLLSDDAKVVKRGERTSVSNANEAGRLAGFGVRMPSAVTAPSQIHVHPAVDVTFSIDVERLQGIFDEAGRADIRIPEELDGEMIRVNIPSAVTTFYGKCPDFMKENDEQSPPPGSRESYRECKVFAQLPSPVIAAPPTLNITQLGTEMLKLFGFSDEQARKFSESIDWATTLVVPLPVSHRMEFQEVTVDGVKGHLFLSRKYSPDYPSSYNLLWIRDGILYSLMGRGNAQEALTIANSM